MVYPLRELRQQKNITLQQIADELSRSGIYVDAKPCHVAKLETRGTDRYPVLRVLANVFETDIPTIADIADPKKCDNMSKNPLTTV